MKTSRRNFLKTSTYLTAGLGLIPETTWAEGKVAVNDRINIGLIGCRNQGFYVLREFLQTGQVNCLGICDVDETVLNEKSIALQKDFQQSPKLYSDFRKMLEDKDIDAVIIGTPDHWHCLQTINACQAGKDVYVEKPLANSIGEGIKMVEAAKQYNRVVQVGQQQRSSPVWIGAMNYIKAGKIGTLRKVNIWANFNYGVGALKATDQSVPDDVDFDFWLGPAPRRSFNPTRFHGNWRLFWDYGGGLMTDWGVHLIDMALWASDTQAEPQTVMSYGKNLSFPKHHRETYDTMSVIWPMDNYVINWQHTAGNQTGPYDMPYGVEFIGDKATVVADRSNWTVKVADKQDKEQANMEAEKFKKTSSFSDVGNHVRNFLDCIRTRNETNCPIDIGNQVAMYAHMGNVVARTESQCLVWEGKNRTFNNPAADMLIMPTYRDPWKL